MDRLPAFLRVFILPMLVALSLSGSPRAEEQAPSPEAWQAAITSQIIAFRERDADAAFGYAAAPFHKTFSDSRHFFFAIIGSGYTPIMTSVSHSFGAYRVLDDGSVGQIVHLVDSDQSLYDAVYALSLEDGAWRVDGVQLIKTPGIGI
ncbi:MAG TPA: DUF4864 domain-containing protein [Devosia sp.]|nr:DUF4864 domain-containing protein [Devosia sp.]